jgi:hypothetical protein
MTARCFRSRSTFCRVFRLQLPVSSLFIFSITSHPIDHSTSLAPPKSAITHPGPVYLRVSVKMKYQTTDGLPPGAASASHDRPRICTLDEVLSLHRIAVENFTHVLGKTRINNTPSLSHVYLGNANVDCAPSNLNLHELPQHFNNIARAGFNTNLNLSRMLIPLRHRQASFLQP